jgi:hypothetical protein
MEKDMNAMGRWIGEGTLALVAMVDALAYLSMVVPTH